MMVVLFVSIMLGAGPLVAQVDTGTVLGTITDQSGAVIPGARVTLTNEATALTLTKTTSSVGAYIFTPIKIGTYRITVEKEGFQKVTQLHVTVNVQAQVKVDLTLVPGRVTQTVEVTSRPPLLQTQTASVGQTVGSREADDLPLNGRNYTYLARLAPGVTPVNSSNDFGMSGTGSFVANGVGNSLNSYILDGIDNNNTETNFMSRGAYVSLTPPDAVQEFKIQTSNFSAEFGRAGGAVINATTKSGTNEFHGDLWDYLRNDKFDAASWSQNRVGTKKTALRQNQFGFTIGGPVVIPHVYNGHSKTFFFGDYQGTRIRQGGLRTDTVPSTPQVQSGYTNYQDLLDANTRTVGDLLGRSFNSNTIFDPATTRPVTAGQVDPVTGLVATANGYVRDPFYSCGSVGGMTNFTGSAQLACLNVLPASRLDPNAIKILQLLPAQNLPIALSAAGSNGTLQNYSTVVSQPDDTDHMDARVDQNFSDRDQAFVRVSYTRTHSLSPGSFSGPASNAGIYSGDFSNRAWNTVLSETHTFSPTVVNEFRVGFSRLSTFTFPGLSTEPGIPEQFGIQGIPQANLNYGLPTMWVSGLGRIGAAGVNIQYSNTWQFSENLTKIQGKHALKAGFEAQFLRFPWINNPQNSRGIFWFQQYTGIPSGPTVTDGVGTASFLLTPTASTVPGGIDYVGGPSQVTASNTVAVDDVRHYYAAYFQDDWKATRRLTLNLGLRWEFFGQPNDRFGRGAYFNNGTYTGLNTASGAKFVIGCKQKDYALAQSFLDVVAKDGVGITYTCQPGLVNSPLANFAPRAGLAWQPMHKLVARLGYGIFFGAFTNMAAVGPPVRYPAKGGSVALQNPSHDRAHPIVYPDGQYATLEHGLLSMQPDPSTPGFSAQNLNSYTLPHDWKNAYTQEWNVSLQYQLTQNQTLTLAYVGNASHHLINQNFVNMPTELLPLDLPQGTTVSDYVPFPDLKSRSNYIAADADAFYYGFSANYETRFSHGFQALVNYTYSHCMSNGRDIQNRYGDQYGPRNTYLPGQSLKDNYHVCGSDVPNLFHASGLWQLPFGHGRRFGRSVSGVADQIIGGWSTQGILTMQNGFPFNIGCSTPTNSDPGVENCVADLLPGENIYSHIGPHGGIDQFLNPYAFANPPVATTFSQTDYAPLGGRPYQAHGPSFNVLDFSLFKDFRTTEDTRLQFRAEFFNLFNHPNFGIPGSLNFLNGQAGRTFSNITSTRGDARVVQFALKFYF